MEAILILGLVLLIALVLLGGLLYRLVRWVYCATGAAARSTPTKLLDTICPECHHINTNYQYGKTHFNLLGNRLHGGVIRGGRGLLPGHVNCIQCGAVYKVW